MNSFFGNNTNNVNTSTNTSNNNTGLNYSFSTMNNSYNNHTNNLKFKPIEIFDGIDKTKKYIMIDNKNTPLEEQRLDYYKKIREEKANYKQVISDNNNNTSNANITFVPIPKNDLFSSTVSFNNFKNNNTENKMASTIFPNNNYDIANNSNSNSNLAYNTSFSITNNQASVVQNQNIIHNQHSISKISNKEADNIINTCVFPTFSTGNTNYTSINMNRSINPNNKFDNSIFNNNYNTNNTNNILKQAYNVSPKNLVIPHEEIMKELEEMKAQEQKKIEIKNYINKMLREIKELDESISNSNSNKQSNYSGSVNDYCDYYINNRFNPKQFNLEKKSKSLISLFDENKLNKKKNMFSINEVKNINDNSKDELEDYEKLRYKYSGGLKVNISRDDMDKANKIEKINKKNLSLEQKDMIRKLIDEVKLKTKRRNITNSQFNYIVSNVDKFIEYYDNNKDNEENSKNNINDANNLILDFWNKDIKPSEISFNNKNDNDNDNDNNNNNKENVNINCNILNQNIFNHSNGIKKTGIFDIIYSKCKNNKNRIYNKTNTPIKNNSNLQIFNSSLLTCTSKKSKPNNSNSNVSSNLKNKLNGNIWTNTTDNIPFPIFDNKNKFKFNINNKKNDFIELIKKAKEMNYDRNWILNNLSFNEYYYLMMNIDVKLTDFFTLTEFVFLDEHGEYSPYHVDCWYFKICGFIYIFNMKAAIEKVFDVKLKEVIAYYNKVNINKENTELHFSTLAENDLIGLVNQYLINSKLIDQNIIYDLTQYYLKISNLSRYLYMNPHSKKLFLDPLYAKKSDFVVKNNTDNTKISNSMQEIMIPFFIRNKSLKNLKIKGVLGAENNSILNKRSSLRFRIVVPNKEGFDIKCLYKYVSKALLFFDIDAEIHEFDVYNKNIFFNYLNHENVMLNNFDVSNSFYKNNPFNNIVLKNTDKKKNEDGVSFFSCSSVSTILDKSD